MTIPIPTLIVDFYNTPICGEDSLTLDQHDLRIAGVLVSLIKNGRRKLDTVINKNTITWLIKKISSGETNEVIFHMRASSQGGQN